jgi:hypothetical protein
MMRARAEKARRLLKVQRDLQRLEEARVAGLQRRRAELSALQEQILAALNAEEGPTGLLVAAFVRRLKSLGEEGARIAEELERRSLALRAQAGRTKYAERRSQAYEQEHAKAQARKELLELLERIVRPQDASLP